MYWCEMVTGSAYHFTLPLPPHQEIQMTNTKELVFTKQHVTKGAIRYAEVLPSGRLAQAPNEEGAVVGTLYMRQSAFPDGKFPDQLKVTIDFD